MNKATANVPQKEFAGLSEEQRRPHGYPVLVPCSIQDWASQIIDYQINGDPRLVNYCTTYTDHYQPPHSFHDVSKPIPMVKVSKKSLNEKLAGSTHKSSFIRFGDPEDYAKSEQYRRSFPPGSAYNETYRFRWCARPKPATQGPAFTMGDPERINERETTYKAHYINKEGVSPEVINQTHEHQLIPLGDYSKKWKTSTSEYLPAIKTEPVFLVKKDRNFSSVPTGDPDPQRNRERMSATSYKYFFSQQNIREPLVRIDGPSKMTRSNVVLGQVGKEGQRYTTTMNTDFPRRTIDKVTPFLPPAGNKQVTPDSDPKLSTMKADYTPVKGKRHSLHPELLDQLKSSHISAPSRRGYFTTAYKEYYAPKPPCRNVLAHVPIQTVSHMPF